MTEKIGPPAGAWKTAGGLGYKDINPWLVEQYMSKAAKSLRMQDLLTLARSARTELYGWIVSYQERETAKGTAFNKFKADWNVARLVIGLQSRLMAEQILWELGPPWRNLVTGFRPIA
jgi:hypothetical protein